MKSPSGCSSRHAHQAEQPVQIIHAVVFDLDAALLLAVMHGDGGGEVAGELLLDGTQGLLQLRAGAPRSAAWAWAD